ncbi:MAG TPA: hypothetical protein VKB79_31015 [Bryobacteraceae bacterium]|nr:hypothetical protein [Bryobacteraceae bacterium]
MFPIDSPIERIALASDIVMRYGDRQRHTITTEQQACIRSLAESECERRMEIDELAREVIEREKRRLRARPRAMAASQAG